ncbi:hypothetical protein AB0N87_07780 [Streptomyces sp. NPDC093228]|uniref:hypothetical protein n=1 Tax=Streptomyces sp. NPDC093228 TaxID=3155070 RepID=UPI00344976D8
MAYVPVPGFDQLPEVDRPYADRIASALPFVITPAPEGDGEVCAGLVARRVNGTLRRMGAELVPVGVVRRYLKRVATGYRLTGEETMIAGFDSVTYRNRYDEMTTRISDEVAA